MWVAETGCSARITPYFLFGLPSSVGIWDTSRGCPKFLKFCDPTEWRPELLGIPKRKSKYVMIPWEDLRAVHVNLVNAGSNLPNWVVGRGARLGRREGCRPLCGWPTRACGWVGGTRWGEHWNPPFIHVL